MNKLKHKIVSFFMIPVLLFSTTSFRVDKHICSDMVYSVSFTGEAEECGMEMNTLEEGMPESCTIDKENCCENETQFVAGSVTDNSANQQWSVEQSLFITYYILSAFFLVPSELNKSEIYKDYAPPVVTKDIQSLFQIFII